MELSLFKSNPELNNRIQRMRNRNALAESLKNNNIDVQTSEEKEEGLLKDETELSEIQRTIGLDVETVGKSRAIEEARQTLTSSLDVGIEENRTAGEIARDTAKKERTYPDVFSKTYTELGGREKLAGYGALGAYGALKAGYPEVAKGLFTGTQLAVGPAGLLLSVVGGEEKDPYNRPFATGSGFFEKISSKVADIHFNVADKIDQGVAGYDQGYLNGELISLHPAFLGLGKGSVLTGNVPEGLTADMFSDMLRKSRIREDEDAISGYAQGNPKAMIDAGITESDFDSATQAARAGIGYSSYDAQGNPTGAAPKGSGFSMTGTFRTGDDNNNDDNNDTSNDDTTSTAEDFNEGGKIGMQMGGDPALQEEPTPQTPTGEIGFVGGPPDQYTDQQTVADDIPKTVPEGAFIINAPAVEFAGKEDIKQMLIKAYEITAQADIDAGIDRTQNAVKIPSKEQVDIMISRGEVIVPPEVAKIIGYDRLEKINNRGKKEVARRQEESQQEEKPQARTVAKGGFINMQNGGNTTVANKPKYKNPSSYIDMLALVTGVYGDSQKAIMDSRQYSIDYKAKDNDKSEDTLRHMLGGGYMADSIFKKLGSFGYDVREFGAFMEELFNQDKDPLNEESRIDLNNNRYGRALRELYPDEKEFKNKAIEIAKNLSQGKKVPQINGMSPMLSLGIAEQNRIFDIRNKKIQDGYKQN